MGLSFPLHFTIFKNKQILLNKLDLPWNSITSSSSKFAGCVGKGSQLQRGKEEHIPVCQTNKPSSKPLELMSSVTCLKCILIVTVILATESCNVRDKPCKLERHIPHSQMYMNGMITMNPIALYLNTKFQSTIL